MVGVARVGQACRQRCRRRGHRHRISAIGCVRLSPVVVRRVGLVRCMFTSARACHPHAGRHGLPALVRRQTFPVRFALRLFTCVTTPVRGTLDRMRSGAHVRPCPLDISGCRFGGDHVGLAVRVQAHAGDGVSAIGLRLGLPGELFTGKAHIAEPNTGEEWQAMRARVSMDCVVTAMVALSFWRANGRIQLDQVAMLHHVASWCQRNTTSDAYSEPLVELRRQTLVQIVEQEAEPV
jgi:hypothetical protein